MKNVVIGVALASALAGASWWAFTAPPDSALDEPALRAEPQELEPARIDSIGDDGLDEPDAGAPDDDAGQ